MKRLMGLIIIISLVLLVIIPAMAEFYKYRDESGAIRYTDDLTEIPPDQREDIDTYDTTEDYQRPMSKKQPSASPNETTASEEKENQKSESQPEMSAEERLAHYKELTQERNALDTEYTEIQEIKNTLDAEKKNTRTASQLRAYNEKVLDLNVRIEAYDQKRKAYEEKLKAFNSSNNDSQ